MLARWAVSRSFSHLRYDALRRAGPRLPPRAHYHAPPTTLSQKLWYRPDGTPRSRLKGLVVVTIASGTLYAMYAMLSILEEFDTANYLLTCLVHIQRVDTELASIDVSDFQSLHSHFQDLCRPCFGDIPHQMIDDFFDDVYNFTGSQRDDAHRVLRETCEELHEILVASKGKDALETAGKVVWRLDRGLASLVEMVEETLTDDFGKLLRNQKIREQVLKDPAGKGGDYEVVG